MHVYAHTHTHTHTYNQINLLYIRNGHNIVNQLYFDKFFFKKILRILIHKEYRQDNSIHIKFKNWE